VKIRSLFILVFAAVAMFGLAPARAASNWYFVDGGAWRCATASGKVSGGIARVTVCNDATGGGSGVNTGVPFVFGPGVITVDALVQTTRGTDRQYSQLNPASPNTGLATGFVMDPAMNTAMIDVTVGSIHAKLTLNAMTEAPTPSESLGEGFGQDTDGPSVCANGHVDVGMSRRATPASGAAITSSRVGGGSLSSVSASMSSGIGGGFDASVSGASQPFPIFFCFF
jgi:hypothetical protein